MTTSRDDIIKLAKEHGAMTNVKSMTSDTDDAIVIFPEELEAFFHAAQKQALPDGYVAVSQAWIGMVCNALRRDAEQGRSVRGEMVDQLDEAIHNRSNHETK